MKSEQNNNDHNMSGVGEVKNVVWFDAETRRKIEREWNYSFLMIQEMKKSLVALRSQ